MPESFNAQLRHWLQRRGWTCAQGAQALAVSPRTMEAWLQGRPCQMQGLVLRAIELIELTRAVKIGRDVGNT